MSCYMFCCLLSETHTSDTPIQPVKLTQKIIHTTLKHTHIKRLLKNSIQGFMEWVYLVHISYVQKQYNNHHPQPVTITPSITSDQEHSPHTMNTQVYSRCRHVQNDVRDGPLY
eukprot:GHVR01185973.1.p1 GENE.GHVR01185973.1~~GHVR01185973.1.p1  ORF type:complete len:113 (-),score=8.24 GHVR01185973.1:271-609(-)